MIKKMKGLVVSLLLILCLLLTACDPEGLYFDYKELRREVTTIELINYDNPDIREVGRKEEILPFDFDKMEIIETLAVEHHEMLLYKISTIYFHICDDLTRYLTSGRGVGIRIIYENGNFVVVFFNEYINFTGEYNKDGSVGEHTLYIAYIPGGNKSFIEMVNTYFETKISYE